MSVGRDGAESPLLRHHGADAEQPLLPEVTVHHPTQAHADMEEPAATPATGGSSSIRNQVLASLAATFGGNVAGLTLGYSSPANPDLQKYIIHATSSEQSLVGSMMPLGALFGCLLAGWLIEKIGRRSTMVVVTIPAFIGWLCIMYASHIGLIIAGRIITGFSCGFTTVVAPTYVGEVTEPRIRGALGAGFQLQITIGILLSYIIGKYAHWNYLAMASSFFPVAWLVLVCFLKESPLWLIDKGREHEAYDALLWLRGRNADINAELAQLRAQNEEMRSKQASFRDLLRPENLKPFGMSLVLMLGQQLCGINAVIFYTTDIFNDAGSSIDGNVATIIVGVVQVLSTFAGVVLVDRLGRKVLLFISDLIMCVCLIVLGVFFYLDKTVDHDVSNIGWLPLVCLMLYIFAFSVGFGPIPWMMMGELFAPEVKGAASGVAAGVNWLLAFIVTETFDAMTKGLTEAGTFWFFSAVCIASALYVFLFVYETKGKSLVEIQDHFK